METIVTWNGQPFEPMDHADYRAAREYVAEFVTFHATEAGCSARRTSPDVWTVTTPDGQITIAIRSQDA
jgi:hypothetical protein